ncbi:MAG: DUF3592 domain-containing protein [Rariglobus sp.]
MRIRFHQSPLGVAFVFWALGVTSLALFTGPQLFHAFKLSLLGETTIGTVTRVEWKRVSMKRSVPYTHYTFVDKSGQMHTGRTQYPSAFLSAPNKDSVQVYYLSRRPEVSDVRNLNHLWGAGATGALLLCILVAIGYHWARQNTYIAV